MIMPLANTEKLPVKRESAQLTVESVSGQSAVTSVFAQNPLKLLTPRSRGQSVWAYTSSFGGGFVAGDETGCNDDAANFFGAELHFDARAFQLVEDTGKRLAIAEGEGEIPQFFGEGDVGVVADAGDFASTLLLDGERLQHVVHFGGAEIEACGFACAQGAETFEIADAVLVKNDFAHRQFGGGEGYGSEERDQDGGLHFKFPQRIYDTVRRRFVRWPR